MVCSVLVINPSGSPGRRIGIEQDWKKKDSQESVPIVRQERVSPRIGEWRRKREETASEVLRWQDVMINWKMGNWLLTYASGKMALFAEMELQVGKDAVMNFILDMLSLGCLWDILGRNTTDWQLNV